ncbi:MAG TPA: hypothetical protein VES60_17685, partial [Nakamurella sp.]|nr:hypothetical protein [Nakamurella sp.]
GIAAVRVSHGSGIRQAGHMAITLPTPLRVAAGIVASGIDLVRSLPEEIPALPVTLVGKAMQLSMKVQQEIADLATKGDELLSGVLGGPQENPPWAQFDDDPPPITAVAAGSRQRDPAGPPMPSGAGSARAGAARASAASTRVAEGGKAPVVTPLARTTPTDQRDDKGNDESDPDAKRRSGGSKDVKTKDGKAKRAKDGKSIEGGKAEPDEDDTPDTSLPIAPASVRPSAAGAAITPTAEPATSETASAESATTEAVANDADGDGDGGNGRPDAARATIEGAALEASTGADSPGTDNESPAGADPAASADSPSADSPSADTQSADSQSADTPSADTQSADTPSADTESANGQAPTSTAAAADDPADPADEPEDGPEALPDYDRMTLAQVRGYLRSLSAQEVQSLLDHEQSGENRAPFLTLLSNRLVTLEHQES